MTIFTGLEIWTTRKGYLEDQRILLIFYKNCNIEFINLVLLKIYLLSFFFCKIQKRDDWRSLGSNSNSIPYSKNWKMYDKDRNTYLVLFVLKKDTVTITGKNT